MKKDTSEKKTSPKYLPDTLRQVAQTFNRYEVNLSRAFKERIAKIKGRR